MTVGADQRLLVTGCAGFIGSHFCERLLDARPGASVVGVDAFTPYYDPFVKRENILACQERGRFRLIEGDIRDVRVHERIKQEGPFTHVVHLAAEVGVRNSLDRPGDYFSVNCAGTAMLMQLLSAQPTPPAFVLASSSSVYGKSARLPFVEDDPCDQPVSPYAASKRGMELLAFAMSNTLGLKVTCLRFFTVYGPRQRPDMAITNFAKRMFTQQPIALFDPDGSGRDYTYVADAVEGLLLALDRPHAEAPPSASHRFRVYNIASGEQIALRDMVRTLQKALNARAYLTEVGPAAGDIERTWADIRRAEAELQYRPSITLSEGMSKSADWLKETAQK